MLITNPWLPLSKYFKWLNSETFFGFPSNHINHRNITQPYILAYQVLWRQTRLFQDEVVPHWSQYLQLSNNIWIMFWWHLYWSWDPGLTKIKHVNSLRQPPCRIYKEMLGIKRFQPLILYCKIFWFSKGILRRYYQSIWSITNNDTMRYIW